MLTAWIEECNEYNIAIAFIFTDFKEAFDS